jgi:hypothetical protein
MQQCSISVLVQRREREREREGERENNNYTFWKIVLGKYIFVAMSGKEVDKSYLTIHKL